MNYWLIIGIIVVAFFGIKYIPRFIIESKRKSCGQSKAGHKWQDCKCIKCGKENHEWEYIHAAPRGGRAGWYQAGQPMTKKVQIHVCKICGKEMMSGHFKWR